MYKLLICWRYLRTRYIALASIISVMLGVATMIVVNSVMAGFSREMQNRIHGIISDLVFESRSMEGMEDADRHMEQIRAVAGPWIEAMTPTVVVPGVLSYRCNGSWMTHPAQIVGIDPSTQGKVSDFSKYLQHPGNREAMSFALREGGFDIRDHQAGPEAHVREQMKGSGWPRRRMMAGEKAFQEHMFRKGSAAAAREGDSPIFVERKSGQSPSDADPFHSRGITPKVEGESFDPAKEQCTGIVLGIAMSSFRTAEGVDRFLVLPGDDVKITVPTAAVDGPLKASSDNFTIVDFYESRMAEYDASFVFVPIRKLQDMRGMVDPASGHRFINNIEIKLKAGVSGEFVRDKLRAAFPGQLYGVYTWRDKQSALLAAVQMETAILNILLFLIIAVAGFGILAIFYMIVVEKTRDIGILKSLGAPGRGVMGIFLGYGLSLGLVGSGVGMVMGLLFVRHINALADLLGRITGHPVFNPEIYYFYRIPTIVDPATVAWIVVGALSIAVAASILPARRAARLHPVEALRYE